MNKIKSFFKLHFQRFLSLFCSVLLSFISLHPFLTVFVAASAGAVIGTVLEWAGYVSSAYDLLSPIFSQSPGGLVEAQYICAWCDIIKDTGISESDFRAYYSEIITNSETYAIDSDEYKTYLLITDTAAHGVSLDAICTIAYHENGTENYTVSDDNNFQLTGVAFKERVDYWHDYYKPKDKAPTASRIYWTTQSSDVPEGFQSYLTGEFDMPLFCTSTNKNGFLGLDWSDLYLLPYVEKADSNGLSQYYYGRYTWHFYIARNDDNLPYLQVDVISLDTSEVSASYTFLKLSTDYPFSTYSNLRFRSNFSTPYYSYLVKAYSSYLDMMSDGSMGFYDPKTFFKLGSYSELCSGSFSNLSTIAFSSSTLSSSSDFGYICQNVMFELWANDTSIDTSKIPDDYLVTVTGDTVYDYSITNTAGDTTTINNYITNNYTIPETEKPSDNENSGSGGNNSSVSGDVNVKGDINVSGDIGFNGQVDINVNVNSGAGENAGDYIDPGTVDSNIDDYISQIPEVSKNFIDYLKDFFGWLPKEIYGLLILGLLVCIFCRINGR